MDSSLEEPMDVNLNSAAVTGGSSNNEQSGLSFEANNGQNLSYSIDGSGDEDFVIEILNTEPIDDASEVEKGASSRTNANQIDGGLIFTQNVFDAHNFNNE